MRVALRRRRLCVSQERANNWQRLTVRDRNGRVGMSQVVESHISQSRAPPNPSPRIGKTHPVPSFSIPVALAWKHERRASEPWPRVQHLDGRFRQEYRLAARLRVWESQGAASKVNVRPP
jgi:hypothetical protein